MHGDMPDHATAAVRFPEDAGRRVELEIEQADDLRVGNSDKLDCSPVVVLFLLPHVVIERAVEKPEHATAEPALFVGVGVRPELEAQAASARRSPAARSRFSRRSNSPAQSEERSGAASMRAMSARPCSARTSTASSRYDCATRVGQALTPARLRIGAHSSSSPAPGPPYHERPSARSDSSSSR